MHKKSMNRRIFLISNINILYYILYILNINNIYLTLKYDNMLKGQLCDVQELCFICFVGKIYYSF